ncbi:MAG: GDYXXLXY domain-containing protein [Kiritimatiellae bacterium]|nr:GDYXXLXY domain-containing protein [Kiritimatiellia bacterium]
MKINKSILGIIFTLLLQLLGTVCFVWRYERILLKGEEVRLKCMPYDPYDPLKGRYLMVTVMEDCTNILFDAETPTVMQNRKKDYYAKLEKTTNGLYRVAAVANKVLDDGLWVKRDNISTRYILRYADKLKDESGEEFYEPQKKLGKMATVSFPNKLFVNEKMAPKAEQLLSSRSKDAVAVYRLLDQKIILTDIEIEGVSILRRVREL